MILNLDNIDININIDINCYSWCTAAGCEPLLSVTVHSCVNAVPHVTQRQGANEQSELKWTESMEVRKMNYMYIYFYYIL